MIGVNQERFTIANNNVYPGTMVRYKNQMRLSNNFSPQPNFIDDLFIFSRVWINPEPSNKYI
jgi:hypothetical protein